MKKFLALLLAFCMCTAVLVACNDDTDVPSDSRSETDEPQQTAEQTENETDGGKQTEEIPEDSDDTDEQTNAPADTDNGEETPDSNTVSIGSVADWEALANSGDPDGADFSGKTVKLTANIDFGTATATTLFKTFKGTFDGCGFTVVGTAANRMSLVANALENATVRNVTLSGFKIASPVVAPQSGVIAMTSAGDEGLTVENVKIVNCVIDGTNVTSGDPGLGMLVGQVTNSPVTVRNVEVSGSITTQGSANLGGLFGVLTGSCESVFESIKVDVDLEGKNIWAGGVIGYLPGTSRLTVNKAVIKGTYSSTGNSGSSCALGGVVGTKNNTAVATGGASEIKNCYIDVKAYSTARYGRAAGIAGVWHKSSGSADSITVENCYVGGEFSVYRSENMLGQAGGLFGEYGSCSSAITLKNVILKAAVDQTYMGSDIVADITKLGTEKSGIIGNSFSTKVDGAESHTVSATGCYTTIVKAADGTDLTLPQGFAAVDGGAVSGMIKYDTNGFISEVTAPAAN